MDFKEYRLPPNPIWKANYLSRILFFWVIPLFKKGYKNCLELEDMFDISDEYRTNRLGNILELYWNEELEKAKVTGKKPRLFKSLLKLIWGGLFTVIIVNAINDCVIVVSQTIFLRLLIAEISKKEEASLWKEYTFAGALSLGVFINTFVVHTLSFTIAQFGMKMRVAVSTLVYRKSLKLSRSSQLNTNSGHIINLLSNDIARFDSNIILFQLIISTPIMFAILMYLLWVEIGLASLVGVGFVISLLPMQYNIGKYSAIFRLKIAKRTDERGRVMSEIINGIRLIKLYAWEKPYSLLISQIRKLEVFELRKRGILHGLQQALVIFGPKLVQYLTFLAYVLIDDKPMTSEKVFFTMACLNLVHLIAVYYTPWAISGIGELYVSVKRMQDFLLLEEQTSNSTCFPPAKPTPYENIHAPRIIMNEFNASWTKSKLTLENISFSLEDSKLLMVVGPVGSSKSSLLHAIIDELPKSSGTLSINGSISYASQEAWIFAGNLRQNILLGLPYDERRYHDTIEACALVEDLKQLPYGDLTVVGERGVALSGGQKARVNLARALYREADIYLLDDPLSAVDTKVSRHLFEKCIKEHLKGSTRILVTHQLQYLHQADHILVFKDGKILTQGSYEELVNSGVDFVGLLESKIISEKDSMKDFLETETQQKPDKQSEDILKPNIMEETKEVGAVSGKTYYNYFRSGHSLLGFLSLVSSFLICQIIASGNDWWLSFWTNAESRKVLISQQNLANCEAPQNSTFCEDDGYLGENVYLFTYTGFVVAIILASLISSIGFYMYCCSISVNIHDRMFKSLVRARTKFFDANPSGRIMNRFTKDMGTLDELLPPVFIEAIVILLQGVGVLAVVIISNYYLSVPTVVVFVLLFYMRKIFVETARDIKRIEAITHSPIFTHVAATLQGLTTIRSADCQDILIKQFEGFQDLHSSSWFMFIGATRCFAIWLELLCDVFLAISAFSFLLLSTSSESGNVGLAISSLMSMMIEFQWGMRQSAETENFMTSVERALEYSKLEPEAELESKADSKPPSNWPEKGEIEFKEMSLSYEKDNPVLKNLSFKILPSEKIGIVGRTGAGKSSIIAALFRMTEPEGEIIIDDVNVQGIGLHDLRKNISIIPQDPVLFSGSVRYNLDPFNQFDDLSLWKVIEEVELKDAIPSLDHEVADGGVNFSVGQKQLICLARTILQKNKILILDEATANVDYKTDNLIQQTIRSKFLDCTVITIAHRLHSIIDCDRILVLDNGLVKEYSAPHELLQDEESAFTKMVNQTGQNASELLRKLALNAYKNKME